jgi:hypothetical protein
MIPINTLLSRQVEARRFDHQLVARVVDVAVLLEQLVGERWIEARPRQVHLAAVVEPLEREVLRVVSDDRPHRIEPSYRRSIINVGAAAAVFCSAGGSCCASARLWPHSAAASTIAARDWFMCGLSSA